MNSHGHKRRGKTTPTYYSWTAMRQRCNNKNYAEYSLYGGRGIKIGEEFDRFEDFLEWMGERPEGMTLDRIDVNGDYVAGNVKWSTYTEQNLNQRIRADNTSGFVGVSYDKSSKKWRAILKGKTLGRFNYPETAHYVYENYKAKEIT